MTPADRTSVRGRSQARGDIPLPSPGPAEDPMKPERTVCAECGRLREQGRVAVLTNDKSRLSDVRVMQQRHRAEVHGQRGQAPI